jgi:hypothetical protein
LEGITDAGNGFIRLRKGLSEVILEINATKSGRYGNKLLAQVTRVYYGNTKVVDN